MIKHGIPNEWTSRLAEQLGIQSVEDLETMEIERAERVPIEFKQQIYDLRNFYVPSDWTLWYISA